jgi:hypothetical protein
MKRFIAVNREDFGCELAAHGPRKHTDLTKRLGMQAGDLAQSNTWRSSSPFASPPRARRVREAT